jgi:hypothetical protein
MVESAGQLELPSPGQLVSRFPRLLVAGFFRETRGRDLAVRSGVYKPNHGNQRQDT